MLFVEHVVVSGIAPRRSSIDDGESRVPVLSVIASDDGIVDAKENSDREAPEPSLSLHASRPNKLLHFIA